MQTKCQQRIWIIIVILTVDGSNYRGTWSGFSHVSVSVFPVYNHHKGLSRSLTCLGHLNNQKQRNGVAARKNVFWMITNLNWPKFFRYKCVWNPRILLWSDCMSVCELVYKPEALVESTAGRSIRIVYKSKILNKGTH